MAIEFECPACGATIRVKDDAANKKGRCPKCKTLLLVPDPGPEEADPPAATAPIATPPVSTHSAPSVPRAEPVEPPAFSPEPPPAPIIIGDANSPFAIPAETAPPVAPVAIRRAAPTTTNTKVISAIAGVLGIGVVLVAGWLLYRETTPTMSGPLTGDRFQTAALEPASFSVPSGVTAEVSGRVIAKLASDELTFKSEYVTVTLTADANRVGVAVEPGPQAAAVRVSLGKNPAVKTALAKSRKAILKVKQKELDEAATELFGDYDTHLTEKTRLARVTEHRDAVAFNATTDAVGYSIEAVIAEVPFRCVAEDGNGNCYFFLPAKTKTFQLRGRTLPDGSTPLPADFEVTVREGRVRQETIKAATGAETDRSEQSPPKADLNEADQIEPEAASMPDEGEPSAES